MVETEMNMERHEVIDAIIANMRVARPLGFEWPAAMWGRKPYFSTASIATLTRFLRKVEAFLAEKGI